jgi:hypothetical protein
MSKPQGLVRPEGLSELTKLNYITGSRSLDLPAGANDNLDKH